MTDTDATEVTARVEETWAAMEVDGETQTIRAETEEEVRSELLRRTQQIAADAGSDVRLVTTDRDGEWRIVVSPDGEISETGEPTVAHGAHNATGEIAITPPADIPTADTPLPSAAIAETRDPSTTWPGSDTEDEPSAAAFYGAWPSDTVTISPPPPGPQTPAVEALTGSQSTPDAPVIDDSIDEDTVVRELPARGVEPLVDQDVVGEIPADAVVTPTFDHGTDASAPAAAPLAPSAPPPPVDPAIAGPPPVLAPAAAMPTLADFRAAQPAPVEGPAQQGWRGALRRGSGGLINPKPSQAEVRHREAVASVTRGLDGPRTICVINPKGGAHKTTATMLIAATFGLHRGGYTLAWDNNESRGTLGWRAHQARHTNTAVDLLDDLERFTDPRSARVGDLDNYVRSQADAQFDVLASDEDAAASSEIDGDGFRRMHETLQRFYRVIVVDTGNNMRASNWEAAVDAADQLVIVSAMREDTAGSAAWMVEGLARKGNEQKLRSAVTVLSAPDKTVDAPLRTRLFDHFGSLTRAVVEVPYDPTLVSGGGITIGSIAPATREAWLMATAKIADGL